MADLADPAVRALLDKPNHAVVSTLNENGSVHSTVVWLSLEDGVPALNSDARRVWPANLRRDPRITVLVYDESNPYEYVEIRGTVTQTTEGAGDHIDRLAKKYLDLDTYPWHLPDEQRVILLVEPTGVRHIKQ